MRDSSSGSSAGFAAPLVQDGLDGRFGPNFQFTADVAQAVPEPSSLYAVMTGLALLGAARWRESRLR